MQPRTVNIQVLEQPCVAPNRAYGALEHVVYLRMSLSENRCPLFRDMF